VHTPEQVHAWVRDVLVPTRETWVAVAGDTLVGMMVLDDSWLDQLYLDPAWRGRGIGAGSSTWPSGAARTDCSCGRSRSTAQPAGSTSATASCRSSGPDGAGNEEREPEVRYQWRPVTVADPK
jgi:GNAT superfamily N-acetyltransferase